jgi:cysteine desulfurase
MNKHDIRVSKDGKAIYMDMQATTPIDPRVLDAMLPYMIAEYGNPHSRTHIYGWEVRRQVFKIVSQGCSQAEDVVEEAREQVARLIGADEKEVVFTSGATESNNIAIKVHLLIDFMCVHMFG